MCVGAEFLFSSLLVSPCIPTISVVSVSPTRDQVLNWTLTYREGSGEVAYFVGTIGVGVGYVAILV